MEDSLVVEVSLVTGRLVVGGMLVIAGVLKYKAGYRWFLRQILAYDLVKGKVAVLLAQGLPWAEILCGVLLMVGFLTPLVTVVSLALLWGFTAIVLSTFLRGKSVDCGCFGPVRQRNQIPWRVAYRNLTLTVLLLFIYVFGPSSFSLDTWLEQRSYPQIDPAAITKQWLILAWMGMLVITACLQGLWQVRFAKRTH